MQQYIDAGFRAVKMKVGRNSAIEMSPLRVTGDRGIAEVSHEEDIQRVKTVRDTIGPDIRLAVDANGEQIGGNVLVTGTAALQFPMPGVKETDQARLSLFTDAGQVYADNAELGDLRYSAGLALAWMTPIGPLSFTYAAALNSESTDETEGFQFSIGSTF
ncbi:MAG: hypothetical protein EBW06_07940 [Gammaproteobacteria bacterium]|nr:hypothetical protein [Gammaproteobacteria bacterium]